jgi:hypothetical protein
MSTRINISIDDGGLVDRNAQQQAAARQANQQRATAEKAAAEGQRQLEEDRIRKGLDPVTGERLPSAGSSSRARRIDQEPAANRRGFPSILLVPSSDYTDYGGTYTGLRSRAKNIPSPIFSRYEYATQTEPTVGLFVPDGGPNGLGALELNPPQFPEGPSATNQYDRRTAQDGTTDFTVRDITYRDPYPTNQPPRIFSTYLVYAAFPSAYDTVPQWMGPSSSIDFQIPLPPYAVVSASNEFVYPSTKHTLNQIGSFTHEFMMRGAAFNYEETTDIVRSVGESTADRIMNLTISAGGVFFDVIVTDWPTTEYFYSNVSVGGIPQLRDVIYKKRFSISARFNAPALYFESPPTPGALPPGSDPEGPLNFQAFYNLEPVNPPAPTVVGREFPTLESPVDTLGGEGWTHIAICRSKANEFGTWKFFINGTQVGLFPLGSDDVFVDRAEWRDTYGTQPPSASLRLTSRLATVANSTPLKPAISGYRFTPKALYSENFTPPTAIEGFR